MRKRYGMGALALAAVVAMLLWRTMAGVTPTPTTSRSTGVEELMSPGSAKTVTFSNEKGQPISKAAFLAALKQGQAYSYSFSGQGSESNVGGLVVDKNAKTSVAFTLGTARADASVSTDGASR